VVEPKGFAPQSTPLYPQSTPFFPELKESVEVQTPLVISSIQARAWLKKETILMQGSYVILRELSLLLAVSSSLKLCIRIRYI
jgi:hypothetical protein